MVCFMSGAKKIGVRNTPQREAVVRVLNEDQSFRSVADIHRALTEAGDKVGLTTVYRTLQSLADADAVDVLHVDGTEALYRLCSDHHHHHLVCTGCGDTVEVTADAVEQWARKLAESYSFQLTGHTAEVFGLCSTCQQSSAA